MLVGDAVLLLPDLIQPSRLVFAAARRSPHMRLRSAVDAQVLPFLAFSPMPSFSSPVFASDLTLARVAGTAGFCAIANPEAASKVARRFDWVVLAMLFFP